MPTASHAPLPFYDAHNHLQDAWLAPHLDALAAQLPALGLRRAVVNGTCEDDWARIAELAARFDWALPSLGLHPWDAGNRSARWLEHLRAALDATPHAVIGEIGLDRWILDRARPDDPRLAGLRRASLEEQTTVFLAQLGLAAQRDLPATIHCIDAWGTLLDVLSEPHTPLPARGFLLHAYAGPAEMIPRFAKLGAYFSFNGAFLADNKARLRETFRHIPSDRLLVETDAPAMSPPAPLYRPYTLPPTPEGSTINHPGNITAAYIGLAALLGLTLADLTAQAQANFQRLFRP